MSRLAAEAHAAAEARAAGRSTCGGRVARRRRRKPRSAILVPWLRRLGFRADEARRAAALCETIPNASLEERVRVALSYFHLKTPSRPRVGSKNLGTAAGLAGADHIREEPVTI